MEQIIIGVGIILVLVGIGSVCFGSELSWFRLFLGEYSVWNQFWVGVLMIVVGIVFMFMGGSQR